MLRRTLHSGKRICAPWPPPTPSALWQVTTIETVEDKDLREYEQKEHKHGDYAVSPLAVPFIAGPDVLVALVLILGRSPEGVVGQIGVFAVVVLVLALTYGTFILAERISRLLGKESIELVNRLLGVLLTALAVQFIVDGLSQSVLFVSAAA